MRRRELLAGLSTATAIGLAGCTVIGGDGPANENPRDDGNESTDPPDDGSTPTDDGGDDSDLQILDATITTTDASCTSAESGESDWSVTGDEVLVTGRFIASTSCVEAVLGGVEASGQTVTVEVDGESTLAEGESCIQCIGAVSYEVAIEVSDGSLVETVSVDHPTRA